jgi:hypothetical protein
VLRNPGRTQTKATVRTDKTGYLAGDRITISGDGFQPFESVSLLVSHAGGAAEAGAGHERFFVTADADGSFTANWTLSAGDRGSVKFVISASSASGTTAQVGFSRTGRIEFDRQTYHPGDKATIHVQGFNPNEPVTIKIKGHEEEPLTAVTDGNGNVSAQVTLPADNPDVAAFDVEVASTASTMTVNAMTIGDFFVISDQLNGQAAVNDTPSQSDMTQMGRLDSAGIYDIFMSWDSTDQWTGSGATGDACALFDTDRDASGNIDFAICGQITNQNGNPAIVVQTTNSPFAFTCSNKRNDRCATPAPFGTAAQIAANIKSGTLADLTRTGNLITPTDPFKGGSNYPNDATLRIQINKNFLPANARLVNLCSYPSAGSGGNNNPFDCIVPPGGNGFIKITKNAPDADSQTTFTFNVTGPASSTRQVNSASNWTTGGIAVPIGSYTESEVNLPAGWTFGGASCTDGTTSTTTPSVSIPVTIGSDTTCKFTNNGQPAHIVLVKNVINLYGGAAQPSDFTVSATGLTSSVSGAGTASGDVKAGTYTLAESGPGGYKSSGWSCTGATVNSNSQITLALGQSATCSITNSDVAAHLKLVKVISNLFGGTAQATDFTLTANGPTPLSGKGGAESDVSAGTYALTESGPSGYTGVWSCSGATLTAGQITLALGQSATCTVTNSDAKATPAGTTVQKWILHDTLSITGIRKGASPAATVKLTLYSDAGCTTAVGSESGLAVTPDASGNATVSTVTGQTVTKPGTYSWIAEYSGDQYNTAFKTSCGSETTTITAKDAVNK